MEINGLQRINTASRKNYSEWRAIFIVAQAHSYEECGSNPAAKKQSSIASGYSTNITHQSAYNTLVVERPYKGRLVKEYSQLRVL